MEQQERSLSQNIRAKVVDGWLNRVEYALAQKRNPSLPIHGAFNELQFRHVSLDLTVVDGPSEAGFHRSLVFVHPSRKGLKLWQITGGDPLAPLASSRCPSLLRTICMKS
jgi:hypothetical protein